MTTVVYVLGVLAVALLIGVSIALHELGHLVPAKRFGVRCTKYMIGFGPTVWSRVRGGTEYGIKNMPLRIQQHGGVLHISSSPGNGTVLGASGPLG